MKKLSNETIAHLRTLFPQLRWVNFDALEAVGQASIAAMQDHLQPAIKKLKDDMGMLQGQLHQACQSQNSAGDKDIINVAEVSMEFALLKFRLSNRRTAMSALKELLATMKQNGIGENLPVLPILRNDKHFKIGDDVMVYFGPINQEFCFSSEKVAATHHWVAGKVLECQQKDDRNTVSVFCNNRAFTISSLEGHVGTFIASMPNIFKRKEFFEMRDLIKGAENLLFENMFARHSQKISDKYGKIEPWVDAITINEMVLDDNIEPLKDHELKKKTPGIIKEILRLAHKHSMYISQAEQLERQLK